ncbi:hydroxylamine reductase [Desulfovibrio sp. OttesenSCG-928-C06]|nr:hydroxylamine reductase [Desulfovibrio sp. OttesenSCG-928-C06]
MFCNQCEQTFQGQGCTKLGVCGKTPEAAAIQDLIVYASRGLAITGLAAAEKGLDVMEAGRTCVAALFSTLTNVNFDTVSLTAMLHRVVDERDKLNARAAEKLCPDSIKVCAFRPAADEKGLLEQAEGIGTRYLAEDANINSLAQTLLYGLKGVAAYTDHAAILGEEDQAHYKDVFASLAFGFDGKERSLDEWVGAVLHCGQSNLRAMELLDSGNTGVYGHPEPTEVPLRPRPGKAILVSGHDLKDLHDLLVQTEGKGINIYTHGEMLPTHAYPGLKKFKHFAGHFGSAWQNQIHELPNFPGPVLFTTNCIQRPRESYHDNVFTTGLVGWPGTTHVKNGDFGAVIARALATPGFSDEQVASYPETKVLVGFGRNTVLGVADKVIDGVKSGAIKHFFLVGGCDGAKPGRNYYTEFVEKAPMDTVILTLACGKFRFFDKQLGDIGGIPRLLDVGQCNDAFSAVKIALALADAFNCGVNDLPLTLILSWYEQKAVAVLLTLLHLGIKNIHLGPSLPAFITPAVLQVLVDNFNITPISTADADLKAALAR